MISTFKFPISVTPNSGVVTKWNNSLIGRMYPQSNFWIWAVWPGKALSDNHLLLFRIQKHWLSVSLSLLTLSNLDYRPQAGDPQFYLCLKTGRSLPGLISFLYNFVESSRNSQNSLFFHPLLLQLYIHRHLVWLPIITGYRLQPVFSQNKCHSISA